MASRLCAFAVLPLALAIVRRADVAEYHVDASAYPAVFAFPQRGECAATLIDNTHALTAAHCFSPGTAGVSMPMSVSLTDSSGNTVAATVRNRFLNPCFSFANDGPNGADLAVLELSSAVPPNVATPVARYTGSTEPGSTFTLIGWGNFGPASPSPPTPWYPRTGSNAGRTTRCCDLVLRDHDRSTHRHERRDVLSARRAIDALACPAPTRRATSCARGVTSSIASWATCSSTRST
jgi:hypothetical protein